MAGEGRQFTTLLAASVVVDGRPSPAMTGWAAYVNTFGRWHYPCLCGEYLLQIVIGDTNFHARMLNQAAVPLPPLHWIGGQGTSPNEQNTQQSPGSGRNSVPQPLQS